MSVLCVTGVAVPAEVVHHSCLGCVWQVYLYQVKMYITVDVCVMWQVYLYLLKMYITVDVCVVCDRYTCTYWRCTSQLMSGLCVTGVPVPTEDVNHSWCLCCVWQVYLYLLKMYLQPPDMSLLGMSPGDMVSTKTNLPAALKLLEDHAHRIDVAKVRWDHTWLRNPP